MGDPVNERISLAFAAFGVVMFFWMAINPRSVANVLFGRHKSIPPGNLYLLRVIAVFNIVCGALSLVWYIVRAL
jgi:ABC-type Mn2+/Zn2+ transport system permease subunit